MLGVFVNTAAVIIGSLTGLLFRKGIPERISEAVMKAIGLCTVMIAVTGMNGENNILITIASMVLGTIIGSLLKIDNTFQKLGNFAEKRMAGKNETSGTISQGFITACLLFCVGAMTIVGCFQAGISGDNTTLYTKSLLDMISAMMLSVSLGIGVLFSAVFVLTFQGGLVLLSGVLEPLLNETAIAELSCTGAILILSLGLNLIGITKLKTSDMLPALLIAPVLSIVFN